MLCAFNVFIVLPCVQLEQSVWSRELLNHVCIHMKICLKHPKLDSNSGLKVVDFFIRTGNNSLCNLEILDQSSLKLFAEILRVIDLITTLTKLYLFAVQGHSYFIDSIIVRACFMFLCLTVSGSQRSWNMIETYHACTYVQLF